MSVAETVVVRVDLTVTEAEETVTVAAADTVEIMIATAAANVRIAAIAAEMTVVSVHAVSADKTARKNPVINPYMTQAFA